MSIHREEEAVGFKVEISTDDLSIWSHGHCREKQKKEARKVFYFMKDMTEFSKS